MKTLPYITLKLLFLMIWNYFYVLRNVFRSSAQLFPQDMWSNLWVTSYVSQPEDTVVLTCLTRWTEARKSNFSRFWTVKFYGWIRNKDMVSTTNSRIISCATASRSFILVTVPEVLRKKLAIFGELIFHKKN